MARPVTVEFEGRTAASLKAATDRTRAAVRGVGDESERIAKKSARGVSRAGAMVAGAVGGFVGSAVAGAVSAVAQPIRDAYAMVKEQQQLSRATDAVIKSTGGAAQVSAGQIKAQADALEQKSLIDAEVIQSGQNMLLTFTNIRNEAGKGNDIFTQASQTMVDYATAMGTEPKAAAIQLGKALNDPVKGISALGKAGVQFTKEQKDQIKTLVEAGDTMSAQKIILGELQTQFGGQAAASANTFEGSMKRVRDTVDGFVEEGITHLLPYLQQGADWLSAKLPAAIEATRSGFAKVQPVLVGIVDGFRAALPVAQGVGSFLINNAPVLAPFAIGIIAIAGALKIWNVAQMILNTTLRANPVGIVITVIGLLVTAFITAYQNSETFRRIVDGAMAGIRSAIETAISAGVTAVRWLIKTFTDVWTGSVIMKNRLVAAFHEANRRIVSTVLGLRDQVVGFFTGLRDRGVGLVVGLRDRGAAAVVGLRDRAVGAVLGLRDRGVAGVMSLRDRAVGYAVSLRDRVVGAGVGLRDRTVAAVTGLRDRAVARVTALRDTAARVAGQLRDRALAPFRTLRDKAGEIFGKLRDSVGRAFSGLTDKIKEPVRSAFSWLNEKLIQPLGKITSKFGLTLPELPTRFHSGTSRVGPGTGEVPAILKADEAVLTGRAADQVGRDRIDAWNRGSGAVGGPGDWLKSFGEFISKPAKLIAELAQRGVRWAVDQVLGAIPALPRSGVPIADVIPGVLDQLRSKVASWASGKEAAQAAELGPPGGSSGSVGSGAWVKPIARAIGNGYLGYPGHYGVDMPAAIGTAVHAISSGVVARSAALTGSYGQHLMIDHPGMRAVYAHLSSRGVSVGQSVKAGEIIARSGNSGNSTGPHLHFETRVGGGYPGPNPRTVMAARGVTLDSGGMLPTGFTLAYNGTGAPEPVLTGGQWADFAKAKDGPQVIIYVQGAIDPDGTARTIAGVLQGAEVRRTGVKAGRRTR